MGLVGLHDRGQAGILYRFRGPHAGILEAIGRDRSLKAIGLQTRVSVSDPVVSLLSLQSSHTDDPHVIGAFDEIEGRVRAIAHIRERLYASHDLTPVEIGGYLAALARELVELHASRPDGVRLQVETEEMLLHIEKAIPVGIIANELVLRPDGSVWAEMCVEDSGPRLPPISIPPKHSPWDTSWSICSYGNSEA